MLKVVGQPDAAKLEKDNPVLRFTRHTVVLFDPDPAFMLHCAGQSQGERRRDIPKDKEKGEEKAAGNQEAATVRFERK